MEKHRQLLIAPLKNREFCTLVLLAQSVRNPRFSQRRSAVHLHIIFIVFHCPLDGVRFIAPRSANPEFRNIYPRDIHTGHIIAPPRKLQPVAAKATGQVPHLFMSFHFQFLYQEIHLTLRIFNPGYILDTQISELSYSNRLSLLSSLDSFRFNAFHSSFVILNTFVISFISSANVSTRWQLQDIADFADGSLVYFI